MYIPVTILDSLVFGFLCITVLSFLIQRFAFRRNWLKKFTVICLALFLVAILSKFWLNKVYIIKGERDYSTNYVLWSFVYTYSNGRKERIETSLGAVINDSNRKLVFEMRGFKSWLDRSPENIEPFTFMNTGKIDYFFERPPKIISPKGWWIYKCYLYY